MPATTPLQAALEAGFTRFRPVLMTALAMIIGMVPMALGLGEGGEQNAPLGRAVIGGLIFATVATLFFVPAVFVMIHGRNGAQRANLPGVPMSDRRLRRPQRSPMRALRQCAWIALAIALMLAVWGIVSRVSPATRSAREPATAAAPRSSRCKPTVAARPEALVLPGNVQAFIEAPIYARTNGYLKRWYTDIGTPVKQGQLLAEIETPEVDQQCGRRRPIWPPRRPTPRSPQHRRALEGAAGEQVGLAAGRRPAGGRRGGQDGGRRRRQRRAAARARVVQARGRTLRRGGHPAQHRHRRADQCGADPGHALFRVADTRLRVYCPCRNRTRRDMRPRHGGGTGLRRAPGQALPGEGGAPPRRSIPPRARCRWNCRWTTARASCSRARTRKCISTWPRNANTLRVPAKRCCSARRAAGRDCRAATTRALEDHRAGARLRHVDRGVSRRRRRATRSSSIRRTRSPMARGAHRAPPPAEPATAVRTARDALRARPPRSRSPARSAPARSRRTTATRDNRRRPRPIRSRAVGRSRACRRRRRGPRGGRFSMISGSMRWRTG